MSCNLYRTVPKGWNPFKFATEMQITRLKHSTSLKKLALNLVSWMLYQVFILLSCLEAVKDTRLSNKVTKIIQHQRLICHFVKRRTNWEMRRTLVSAPAITPTYDCGAFLLGAVLILYLFRKRTLKLQDVSFKSSVILARLVHDTLII